MQSWTGTKAWGFRHEHMPGAPLCNDHKVGLLRMSQKLVGREPCARSSSEWHPQRLHIFQGASFPLDPCGHLFSLPAQARQAASRQLTPCSPYFGGISKSPTPKKSWDELQLTQHLLTGQTHACNDLAKKCTKMYLSPAQGSFQSNWWHSIWETNISPTTSS